MRAVLVNFLCSKLGAYYNKYGSHWSELDVHCFTVCIGQVFVSTHVDCVIRLLQYSMNIYTVEIDHRSDSWQNGP